MSPDLEANDEHSNIRNGVRHVFAEKANRDWCSSSTMSFTVLTGSEALSELHGIEGSSEAET